MKKIILFLLWVSFFILFEFILFKFKFEIPLGYAFFEMSLNSFDIDYLFMKKFVLLLVGFSFISFLIVYFLRKLNILVLSGVLVIVVFLLNLNGVFNSLVEGIKTYDIVHNLKIKTLKNDTNITFKCLLDRMIAHAGGEINKDIYTDSLEALDNSYKKGLRYFELDIRKTKDGYYVVVHLWKQWKKFTGYKKEDIPTLKEFLSYKILGKYTPLDMKRINEWFETHKDAILITDKVNTPVDFTNKFIDKNRVMMELFSMESVLKAKQNNIIAMPTWDSVVRFMVKNRTLLLKNLGIEYVVVPDYDFVNPEFKQVFKNFSHNGIKVYLYGNYDNKIKPYYYYGRYINNLRFCK